MSVVLGPRAGRADALVILYLDDQILQGRIHCRRGHHLNTKMTDITSSRVFTYYCSVEDLGDVFMRGKGTVSRNRASPPPSISSSSYSSRIVRIVKLRLSSVGFLSSEVRIASSKTRSSNSSMWKVQFLIVVLSPNAVIICVTPSPAQPEILTKHLLHFFE